MVSLFVRLYPKSIYLAIHPRRKSVSSTILALLDLKSCLHWQWTFSARICKNTLISLLVSRSRTVDTHSKCVLQYFQLPNCFPKVAIPFHTATARHGFQLLHVLTIQCHRFKFSAIYSRHTALKSHWFCFAFLWWLMSFKKTFFCVGWWDGSEGRDLTTKSPS